MHSWSKLQEGYLYCENDYDMLKLCNSKQTVFSELLGEFWKCPIYFLPIDSFLSGKTASALTWKTTDSEQSQSTDIAWLHWGARQLCVLMTSAPSEAHSAFFYLVSFVLCFRRHLIKKQCD